MQANIPLGVCFEIGYWYRSKYYRIVPDVIGLDINLAVNTVNSEGFTTVELFGSNLNTKISKQEPPGGTYVHKATSVKLTAEDIVIVPWVVSLTFEGAEDLLKRRGLGAAVDGTGTGSWVKNQKPEARERVARGSIVTLTMGSGPQP